ncbi:hypothetical protein GobsT_35750 [Gemmata obscuriglobus]|uniref:Uncharacterized protein n=1 Tax=Gemmata obscuriglobus TaxID=114 RepID=A0A2Z3GV78_9BACT|nr:sigma factor [Gemmata obscuriglobus]AWM38299.1 hypothetical protein C1280_15765 [Gemmata obscuriglobus]QEG28788.1 hypothetical protein GobsT_35750 [Gemmata obscuriglobus]VTS07146.1 hypothetical protein : : Sigma70_r2 [Gemmata obscuriglobus UQM 2246]
MNWPHGIPEAEFLAAVAHVARVLAAKFQFGMHDADDITQMVAVYALEALPRYDPVKGNLEGFV